MATSAAVLERAGLGILADNDNNPGAVPRSTPPQEYGAEPLFPAPASGPAGDFECFLADLKQEVEQPLFSAMAQALRATLSKLVRIGES
jgi:hypothetical protein